MPKNHLALALRMVVDIPQTESLWGEDARRTLRLRRDHEPGFARHELVRPSSAIRLAIQEQNGLGWVIGCGHAGAWPSRAVGTREQAATRERGPPVKEVLQLPLTPLTEHGDSV